MIIVWWFVIVISSLIVFGGLYAWLESVIFKYEPIPEFESEKHVRDLKMRIADAEWKFHRELDKYR